jgi:hypothetical protein
MGWQDGRIVIYDTSSAAWIVGALTLLAVVLWAAQVAYQERKSWYETLAYVEWCEKYARDWSDPKIQPDPFLADPFLIEFHPLGEGSRNIQTHPDLHERYMLAYDLYHRANLVRYPSSAVGVLRGRHG